MLKSYRTQLQFICTMLLTAAVFTFNLNTVLAQETGSTIEYGQTVTGEITNQSFEIEYSFVGSEGDVIVIEMKDPAGFSGTLDSPSIILLNSDYEVLGSVDGLSGFTVTLVAQLPTDGEYVILATRRDGRSGDSIGAYTLDLIKPQVLIPNEPVEGSASTDNRAYYVVEVADEFAITYERLRGDFYPEVGVTVIDNFELNLVASLSGEMLSSGSIDVIPIIKTSQSFVIVIQVPLFQFNFAVKTVDFIISLASD